MPVELNTLFAQVQALSDERQFHVDNGGDLAEGSGLHGLSRLSRSAHRAENRLAVTAFMQSLEANPSFAALLDEVRAPLDLLMEKGRPLTGAAVRSTKLALDVAQATALGRALAADGKLPPGHGASFGQFVVARGIPFDAPQAQAAAVREYISSEVIGKNLPALTHLPDFGDRNAVVGRLMNVLHGPQERFLADAAARMLEDGLEHFSLEALEGAWQDACADDIAVCRNIRPQALDSLLSVGRPADTMAALREALPLVGPDNLTVFRQSLFNAPSLSTPEARAEALADFFLNRDAASLAAPLTQARGLPEAFATAVGHNPSVLAEAKAALAEAPGAGVMPTCEAVKTAFEAAVAHFLDSNGALLHEFHVMSEHPPIDMHPPLTPETMARYINTMLAGDAVLEVLVNDGTPIDAAFMTKLGEEAQAMNSAAHSVRGDFGADDANSVLEGSLRLLLARRGVPAEMLPELASRAVAKFGTLGCDLSSVNGAIQEGRFRGAAAMRCLSDCMSVYRLLEGQSVALLSMLTDEERAALGAGAFNPDQPGLSRSEVSGARAAYLETNFQTERPLEQVTGGVRAFVEARGIALPDAAPDAPDSARTALAESNRRMGEAVLGLLVRSNPQASSARGTGAPADAFRAFAAEAAREGALNHIDFEKLNTAPLAEAASRAVRGYVNAQTEAGAPADPALCRALAEGALHEGLEALEAMLDEIERLPVRDGAFFDGTGCTAEAKAVLTDAVHRLSIRDMNVVGLIAGAAGKKILDVRDLSAPDATPAQLAEVVKSLSDAFARLERSLPEGTPPSKDILAMFAAVSLSCAGLDAQDAGHLLANLKSGTAQRVAAGFKWLEEQGFGERVLADAARAFDMMNAFRMEADRAASGTAEEAFYDQTAQDLRDIPGGVNGMIRVLKSMAGEGISELEAAMANVSPPLSDEACGVVRDCWTRYGDETAASAKGILLPLWLADGADALVEAARAAKGGTPSLSQMWDVLTGGALGRMPKTVKNGTMAQLIDAVDAGYQKLCRAAAPDMPDALADSMLLNLSSLHLPLPKLLSLARAGGAELSLADVRGGLEMSSLRGCTAENAYGLTADFRRQAQEATLTFRTAGGEEMAIHPEWIPDAENRPDHPTIRGITDFWQGMTQSDAQLRRLGQAFSQASLIVPRIYSQCFPGIQYSEHGAFAMTAEARADGTIVVDIGTAPDAPVAMHEQFEIRPDGSHACTAFTMRRAPAG